MVVRSTLARELERENAELRKNRDHWRANHANYTPTREELFGMLSVIDSYRSLLAKPAKRQRTLARALLQFILPNVQGAGTA